MTERSVRRISNINDLPDEILCRIISLIPTKEAVRTSVLSTRWRYLFTSISNLDIQMDSNDEEESIRFMDFVDRIVFFPDRPSILRFRLYCKAYIDPQRLEKCISALVQHKVERLYIRTGTIFEGFLLPASLFSCETLVVLDLFVRWYSHLQIPSRIYLPRLMNLSIQGYRFPDDGSEDRLFSSCPVLEHLMIVGSHFGKGCINFSISNKNLRKLTLKFLEPGEERIVPILIKAPNLAFLNYNLGGRHSLVFLDVKSLEKVIISSAARWRERHVNAAPNVLRGIQNIRTLQISSCILQDLHRHNVPIPVFGKLTCLRFVEWKLGSDSNGLEYLLSRCVVLETLSLSEMFQSPPEQDTGIRFSLQESLLTCLSSHLKTVQIHFHHAKETEALMAILKFFLKNGKVLEELKISGKSSTPQQRLLIMDELSSFPKASKICRVSFN